jgi:hypothetical protein
MFWLSLGDGAFQRSVIHAIDQAGHPWRRLPDVSSFTPGDGVLITDLSLPQATTRVMSGRSRQPTSDSVFDEHDRTASCPTVS